MTASQTQTATELDVTCDLTDGIATITLNRPQAMNALAGTMREDILAGLRRAEICALTTDDYQLHPTPMLVVRNGKGGKDRFVPLSPDTLAVARAWWQVARPRGWLFGTLREVLQTV